MNTLRGYDSTGICSVENDGKVQVLKKSTWAPNFMVSKAFSEVEKTLISSGKFFLGHNRKATVGKVTSANAHPFVIDNEFVLMHNGSLPTHKHLGDHEVDSEAIAQYLHTNWDDELTLEEKAKLLSHIGGAYALVWYDLRSEKLNIVRNSQRPLYYATMTGTIFWASDEHMLRCALSRNYNNSNMFTIKSLPAYTLLTHDGKGLQEVALPTVPFPQVKTTTPQVSTTGCGSGATIEPSMSKAQFKKWLRAITGKEVEFNVEDFVDVRGVNTWYGEKPDWSFSHELVGTTSDEVMLEVLNNYSMGRGIVTNATYDKISHHITVYINLKGTYVQTPACH